MSEPTEAEDRRETAYLAGSARANHLRLIQAMNAVRADGDDPDMELAGALTELAGARASLLTWASDLGIDDVPANLDLQDVIRKYIRPAVEDNE